MEKLSPYNVEYLSGEESKHLSIHDNHYTSTNKYYTKATDNYKTLDHSDLQNHTEMQLLGGTSVINIESKPSQIKRVDTLMRKSTNYIPSKNV